MSAEECLRLGIFKNVVSNPTDACNKAAKLLEYEKCQRGSYKFKECREYVFNRHFLKKFNISPAQDDYNFRDEKLRKELLYILVDTTLLRDANWQDLHNQPVINKDLAKYDPLQSFLFRHSIILLDDECSGLDSSQRNYVKNDRYQLENYRNLLKYFIDDNCGICGKHRDGNLDLAIGPWVQIVSDINQAETCEARNVDTPWQAPEDPSAGNFEPPDTPHVGPKPNVVNPPAGLLPTVTPPSNSSFLENLYLMIAFFGCLLLVFIVLRFRSPVKKSSTAERTSEPKNQRKSRQQPEPTDASTQRQAMLSQNLPPPVQHHMPPYVMPASAYAASLAPPPSVYTSASLPDLQGYPISKQKHFENMSDDMNLLNQYRMQPRSHFNPNLVDANTPWD